MEAITVELDGQYRALREECGCLRREMAVISVSGPEAAEYLESQVTNEVETLSPSSERAPGGGCYAALLDRKGHMRGDMRVLRTAGDRLLVLTEVAAAEAISSHLGTYRVGREVEVEDLSAEQALISLIGPMSAEVAGAAPLGAENDHLEAIMDGVPCRLVATDVGIDLLCSADAAADVEAFLAGAGAAPVSEAAAEIIRVEGGRPRFGREMTTETIPQEAGINERAVSFTKGCYIGQETVARLHYKGKPNRHLRGLELEAPAGAGEGISIDGKVVGTVGTAVISPARGPIALAIVRREAEPGARVEVGDDTAAEVVELPFGGT
jgi:folate-binding protein YgfZ